jgi:hypothetical protein
MVAAPYADLLNSYLYGYYPTKCAAIETSTPTLDELISFESAALVNLQGSETDNALAELFRSITGAGERVTNFTNEHQTLIKILGASMLGFAILTFITKTLSMCNEIKKLAEPRPGLQSAGSPSSNDDEYDFINSPYMANDFEPVLGQTFYRGFEEGKHFLPTLQQQCIISRNDMTVGDYYHGFSDHQPDDLTLLHFHICNDCNRIYAHAHSYNSSIEIHTKHRNLCPACLHGTDEIDVDDSDTRPLIRRIENWLRSRIGEPFLSYGKKFLGLLHAMFSALKRIGGVSLKWIMGCLSASSIVAMLRDVFTVSKGIDSIPRLFASIGNFIAKILGWATGRSVYRSAEARELAYIRFIAQFLPAQVTAIISNPQAILNTPGGRELICSTYKLANEVAEYYAAHPDVASKDRSIGLLLNRISSF